MDHTPYKPSKIPVFNKRVKMLKPIRHQKLVESDCFKYCRNCCNLKNDLSVLEQNLKTLLKENNFLRQQLSLSESSSDTNNSKQVTTISSVVEGEEQDISQNGCNSPAYTYSNQNSIQPFYLLSGHSFSNFDVNLLCSETDYSHCLSNRKVKFYGDAPYRYGDTYHDPCPVPQNSYVLTIIDQVKLMFPHYSFNSVLINQYDNGSNHIPMHADDETQIKPDSDILTISFGESRIIRFCPKNNVLGSEASINLQHGDVFIMSAVSQKLFKHGISREFGKGMRISLTFRDLIHTQEINSSFASTDISLDLSAIETTLASTPGALNTIPNNGPNSTPLSVESNTHLTSKNINTPIKSYQNELAPFNVSDGSVETILISSSMFADLDESKLSSEHQKVKVFFYRGATAGGILRRLKNDPEFLAINPDNIKQVFMMCGTNDVDNILHVDKNMHTNINVDFKNFDIHRFDNTTNDVECLVDFIHGWSSKAKINLINVLPRASRHRNNVINNINQYIRNICLRNNYLNFIDTEFKLYLFSNSDGYRKSIYFKPIGTDNVHLNKSGVVRFGKHLKYLLHLNCPRGQTST